MIESIRHTGLVVVDLDKSTHFWCNILDFKIQKKIVESGPHIDEMLNLKGVKVTTLKLCAKDGSMLELLNFHSHPDAEVWNGVACTTGFTHIALKVDDIELCLTKLREAGFGINRLPQNSLDGSVKVTYVRGPENILIELVEVVE